MTILRKKTYIISFLFEHFQQQLSSSAATTASDQRNTQTLHSSAFKNGILTFTRLDPLLSVYLKTLRQYDDDDEK